VKMGMFSSWQPRGVAINSKKVLGRDARAQSKKEHDLKRKGEGLPP
jgi:hypothetical protein